MQNLRNADFTELAYMAPICVVFFVIMSINGGLLDELTDAWWHMSYANKISETNTIFLDRQHLSGIPITNWLTYFKYLPGWHLILALIQQSSGLPLTKIWHHIASFLVPICLMSYFLFARALTRDVLIAVVSIFIFSISLGGLNSYFRVAPWPGNVSYVVWYFLFYLAFTLLNQFQFEKDVAGAGFIDFIGWLFVKKTQLLIGGVICAYLILSIHASELLWFLISFIFYFLVANLFVTDNPQTKTDFQVLKWPVVIILLLAILYFIYKKWPQFNIDLLLAAFSFITLLLLGQLLQWTKPVKIKPVYLSIFVLAGLFVILASDSQLYTLFNPVEVRLSPHGYHHPFNVQGLFSNALALPQWEHQLREGLMFTGLISLFISMYFAVKLNNRACIFLFANCFMALLTLCSPYLFTFLNQFTPYTSTYRVHLLIFHPIIFAYCICLVSDSIFKKEKYDFGV